MRNKLFLSAADELHEHKSVDESVPFAAEGQGGNGRYKLEKLSKCHAVHGII